MKIRSQISIATLIFSCSIPVAAQQLTVTDHVTRELPIYIGGLFVLENTEGDIGVVGTDDVKVVVTAEKSVRASDRAALDEGREQTQLALLGDARVRLVKTVIPPIHSGKWSSGMKYTVRVPRTVQVKIVSMAMVNTNSIHVADVRGNVVVKSFNGGVLIDGVTGPTVVDSANANIVFIAPER